MSKIGKTPIEITKGVSTEIKDDMVKIIGPKGTFSYPLPDGIAVELSDGKLVVFQNKDMKSSAQYGLTRATIANMIAGVTQGFEKKLELSGVGYRAQVSGSDLVLSIGFSHPVKVAAIPGISFNVSENVITISGIDKGLVGDVAAKIRSIRPPEPYKGKGISYLGERIRRKAGKAAKAVGATTK
jgi:large subunit ribosomal protein L6